MAMRVPTTLEDVVNQLRRVKIELSKLMRGEQFLKGARRTEFKKRIVKAHSNCAQAVDEVLDEVNGIPQEEKVEPASGTPDDPHVIDEDV